MNTINKTMRVLIIAALAACLYHTAQAQLEPQGPEFSILFTYDAAGNRVKREVISLFSPLKTSGDTTKTASSETPEEETGKQQADAKEQTKESFEGSLGGSMVQIFPNPVEEKLTVEISNLENGPASLLLVNDMEGRQLYKKENLQQTNELNFSKHADGAYILRIVIDGVQKEWVVIKE